MTFDEPGSVDHGERWDQVYHVLSAEPRREIIRSLVEAPRKRRLPLPEAAESPNQSRDTERLEILLRHQHLPKLAHIGYVRWEEDPFCVQRGPRFREVGFVVETLLDEVEEIPPPLVENCVVLQEMTDRDSN